VNVLCLTNILPFRKRTGGEICSARMIGEVAHIASRVTVVGRGDDRGAPYGVESVSIAPIAAEFSMLTRGGKVAALARAALGGQALSVSRMAADGFADKLRGLTASRAFDCVVVDHLQMFEVMRQAGLQKPVVLMTQNVEPDVYRGLCDQTTSSAARYVLSREARLLEHLDAQALRQVRGVGCVTDIDARYYTALASRLGVTPLVRVLPSYFDPAPAKAVVPTPRNGRHRIGIIGTWTWESNRRGLAWFLDEVLPRFDASYEVVIAGLGLDTGVVGLRARYLGFVDSIEQFYADCDVIAIPSTHGSGVQEKTIEAIGRIAPVVATPIAMRGLSSHPSHIQVASSAEAFAAACMSASIADRDSIRAEAYRWNDERRAMYACNLRDLMTAVSG
jgi:polysaccharide biosynthesis protein PslH